MFPLSPGERAGVRGSANSRFVVGVLDFPGAVQILHRPPENPRIINRPPPYAPPGETLIIKHLLRPLRSNDVTVPNPRDLFPRLHPRANTRQVHRPAKTL